VRRGSAEARAEPGRRRPCLAPVETAWRTDKVAGPTGDLILSGWAPYWTLNKWDLP